MLAFFNEGGSRLYVSRAVSATAAAAGVQVTPAATPAADSVAFAARFLGSVGNGLVVVQETVSPGSLVTMISARPGTLLRSGRR